MAIFAEGIGVVGTTEHGEHVGMELLLAAGEKISVLFPAALFQSVMTALMAAGAAAHQKQITRLGSEEAALLHAGAQPFTPTEWAFGRARTRDGHDVLMMRLKKDGTPVVDVALTISDSEQFAQQMLAALRQGPPPPRINQ